MTCKELQRRIVPFIQEGLDDVELEHFIDHINNCSECKEEYDVYYTLLTSIKMLDEDKTDETIMVLDSMKKLRKEEERLVKEKMRKMRKRMFLTTAILFFAIALK